MPWLLVIPAVGLACVAWGVIVERRWYRLVRRRLPILPSDGPASLTILHLSDLHFTRGERRKARFLASLPTADVTVVTGDFLAESAAVERTVRDVAPTRGRLASWFVLGSNDHHEPRFVNPLRYLLPHRRRRPRAAARGRPDDLIRLLVADGWEDLTDSRRDLDLGGLAVELLGLDDAHIRRHDPRVMPRSSPERFGIAVMHSPDTAPEAIALGYDLVLAGHTHGGQVALPLVGPLITNSAMPRRSAAGVFTAAGSVLVISQGLGTSRFAPFRFLCRPEAMLLELVPRPT